MHWGRLKSEGNRPSSDIVRKVNSVLDNPKSKKEDIDAALKSIGVGKDGKVIKQLAKDDIKRSKDFVKTYLKLAGASVVAGLVVSKLGQIAAQRYIDALAVKRYADLYGSLVK
jgi:hypothetical protein